MITRYLQLSSGLGRLMTVFKIIKSAYVSFVYKTAPFFSLSPERNLWWFLKYWHCRLWVKVTTIITNLFFFPPPRTPCHLGKGHTKQRRKAGTFSTFNPNFALFPLPGCLICSLTCVLPLKLLSLFSLPSNDSLPYSLTQNRLSPWRRHHRLRFHESFFFAN